MNSQKLLTIQHRKTFRRTKNKESLLGMHSSVCQNVFLCIMVSGFIRFLLKDAYVNKTNTLNLTMYFMTRVKFKNTVRVPWDRNKATTPDKQFVFVIYSSSKEGENYYRMWVPKTLWFNCKLIWWRKKMCFLFDSRVHLHNNTWEK